MRLLHVTIQAHKNYAGHLMDSGAYETALSVLRRAWYGTSGTYDSVATGVHDVTLYLATVLGHLAADGCREATRLENLPQESHKPAIIQRIKKLRRRSALLWGEARSVCDEGLNERLPSMPVQFGNWDQSMAHIAALRALLEPSETDRRLLADYAESLNKEKQQNTKAMVDLARGLYQFESTPPQMPCGVGLGYLTFGPPKYSSRPLR